MDPSDQEHHDDSAGDGVTHEIALGQVLRPGALLGLGREVVAGAAAIAALPLGLIDRGLAAATRRNEPALVDTPVLLVHGYGMNKSNWLFLERYLRQAGFGNIHSINCNAFRDDIPHLAAHVRDRARALMAQSGSSTVHLVGHSMGGLVSRWAVQVLGLHEARTVVTVASPHGGSALAQFGIGRSAAQMRPGSDLLRRLHAATAPASTAFIAYFSELDALVSPTRAQIRDTRLAPTNVHVPGEGHMSILLSRTLADSVLTQLAAAEGLGGYGTSIRALTRSGTGATTAPTASVARAAG